MYVQLPRPVRRIKAFLKVVLSRNDGGAAVADDKGRYHSQKHIKLLL